MLAWMIPPGAIGPGVRHSWPRRRYSRAPGVWSYSTLTVRMLLYVVDVDDTVNRAVAAGAKVVRPVEDQFYGDRAGGLEDPFGHYWHVATHIEDVSAEEMERRAAAFTASGG